MKNENYREQTKTLIMHVDNIVDPQFHWKYLKYKIRKFPIYFSKGIAQNKKTKRRKYLEIKIKALENSPSFVNNPEYIETNEKLDKIYQRKANGITSKCNRYEHWEKILKFCVNLERFRAVQNQIWNILKDNTEIVNQKDINKEFYLYYKNNERQHLSEHGMNNFLNIVSNFPQLSTEQSLEYEKDITEKELLEVLKSMPNDNSLGNDGLTKRIFRNILVWSKKKTFLSCVSHSFDKGELYTTQRQAIIQLIEKKTKIKD